MKILKRIGIGLAILCGVFILTSVVLGYIYRDELQNLAISEFERSTGTEIVVSSADLSFLSSWPYVTVSLENLDVKIPGEATQAELGRVREAEFKIDLLSFFSDRYEVKKIVFHEPELYLVADSTGHWNYRSLFKKDSAEDSSSDEVLLSLKNAEVINGKVVIQDPRHEVMIDLDSLNIDLAGDFTSTLSLLESQLNFHIVEWQSGGFSWLRNKNVQSAFRLGYENADSNSMHFKEGQIHVGDLVLDAGGDLTFAGEDIGVDFEFKTNSNTFAGFLALLPSGLVDFGHEYEYSGDFMLDGSWKGWFADGDIPVFETEFAVSDGMMKYAGYSSSAEQVQLAGNILVDPAKPRSSGIRVQNGSFKLGNGSLSGNFSYLNFDDPKIDGRVHGTVDMDALNAFYPFLADSMVLKGQIVADISGKGRYEDLKKRPERMRWSGGVDMTDVRIESPDIDLPLSGMTGKLKLESTSLKIQNVVGAYGSSDFKLNGKVDGFLPYMFDAEKNMKGNLRLASKKIDVNEMMASEHSKKYGSTENVYHFELPENIDFHIRADVNEFIFDEMHARLSGGKSRVHSNGIVMKDLDLYAFGGHAKIYGQVDFLSTDRATIQMNTEWSNLDVNSTCKTFRQWADMTLVEDHIHGTFDGNLEWSGEVNDHLLLDYKSLRATGHVELRNGQILGYEPLEALAGFVKLDKLRDVRFSDMETDFSIKDEYFIIPDLHLQAYEYVIDVSGRHGLDNTLEYDLLVDMPPLIAKKIKERKASEWIAVQDKKEVNIILPIKVRGNVDDPEFSYDFRFASKRVKSETKEERQEIVTGIQKDAEELFGEDPNQEVSDWIVEAAPPSKSKKPIKLNAQIGKGLTNFGKKLTKRKRSKNLD